MASFDRVDGVFTTRYAGTSGCTFDERFIFKNAGWVYNPALKAWTTTIDGDAKKVREYAVNSAATYIENVEQLDRQILAASWAEDTDAEYPAPKGLAYLPFQKAGIEYALQRTNTLIGDAPGLGKSHPDSTLIRKKSGWIAVGSLSKGDYISGVDGTQIRVTGVFNRGMMPTYRVKFRDGTSVECGLDHLWKVKKKAHGSWEVKTTQEILKHGVKDNQGKSIWQIPLITPEENTESEFVIGPYTMGVLLGDGSLHGTSPCVSIANNEEEIKRGIESELFPEYRLNSGRKNGGCPQYTISRERCGSKKSVYVRELSRLKLRVRGDSKFIPTEYLNASIAQRVALLRGLMDSDGSAKQNRCTFHNMCKKLCEDVVTLVQSLGGVAILRGYDRGQKGVEYQVNVKLNSVCPFNLTRKAKQWWPSKNNGPKRYITEIVETCVKNHVCISVDSADRLYVTENYIVTHNTVQAVGVHNAKRVNKVLIVCPASLKINWQREWIRWDIHGNTVELAQSVSKSKKLEDGVSRWTEYYWPNSNVVIINYDMLETFDEWIKDTEWDLAIFDECHLLKSSEAIRTKCVFGGKRKVKKKGRVVIKPEKVFDAIRAKRRLFLTGTPILSKPSELWNLVSACDPTGLGRNWTDFVFRYCGAYDDDFGLNTDGATNLDELQKLLRERFMVRRDKRSVLSELPDKRREPILLPKDKLEAPIKRELSRVEAALAAYEKMAGIPENTNPFRFIEAFDSLSKNLEEAFSAQSGEEPNWEEALKMLSAPDQLLFTEMSSAREEVALAKVGMVVEHIEKLVDCGEPVICFAYHKSVVAAIQERLEKAGLRVGIVTGSVPPNKRQAVVDSFQNGELDVILGNIVAMGVGYTLTRARFVVFAEMDWVPALMEQAEDRAWRHGQKNAVIAQYLVVDGSIEATIAIAILEKMEIIMQALGVNNPLKPPVK